jgi:16S rRNA A1518/A1519 N6-dimethyltransferase RsmA/KsgA/DIM1 with predicted DNA glycosylase/AP lyase activity
MLTPQNRLEELGIGDADAFLRFLSACFRQKRKTLRNNLRPAYAIDGQPEEGQRAEQLSLAQLADLWQRLQT